MSLKRSGSSRLEREAAGQRLDNYLLRELKGCPKSRIYRMIRSGEVRINKKRAKPGSRLDAGDQVRIPPVRLGEKVAAPKPGERLRKLLEDSVLYENDNYLVIDKPAGMAVHGGSGVRLGMVEALRQMQPAWAGLELVHRLDRDTSGCMVIAKNTIFVRQINKLFKLRSASKKYLALVVGQWPGGQTQRGCSFAEERPRVRGTHSPYRYGGKACDYAL